MARRTAAPSRTEGIMTDIYFAMATCDAREAFHPWSKPYSRECEQCPKTAWLLDTEIRDGYRIEMFCCSNGHQKWTQEKAEGC